MEEVGKILNLIQSKLPNPYATTIIALILIAIVNGEGFGYDKVLLSGIIAVIIAVGIEAIVIYMKTKKIVLSQSAAISGLIITNIFLPGEYLLVGATSAVTIVLKTLIKWKNRPLFNPAALGLFIMFLIYPANEAWWGDSNALAILIVGLIVSWRIRKLQFSIPYLITYIVLRYLQIGQPALEFFPFFAAFIMFTEPKTTPVKDSIIGAVIGAVAVNLFLFVNMNFQIGIPSAALLGILVVNVTRILLK